MELLINKLFETGRSTLTGRLGKIMIPLSVLGYYMIDNLNLGFWTTNFLELVLMILLFMSVKANYLGFTFNNSINRKSK